MANAGSGISINNSMNNWNNANLLQFGNCSSSNGTYCGGSSIIGTSNYLFGFKYPSISLSGTINSIDVDIIRGAKVLGGMNPRITDVTVQFASGNDANNPTSVTLIGNNMASTSPWDSGGTCVDKSYSFRQADWGLTDSQLISLLNGDPHMGIVLQANISQQSIIGLVSQINLSFSVSAFTSNGFPLFIKGPTPISSDIPLFLETNTPSTNTVPLFTWGSTLFSGGIPLYVNGYIVDSGGIPLFTNAAGTINSGLPLYTSAVGVSNNNVPLYTYASATSNNTIPLCLQNTVGYQCFGPFYPQNVAVNSGIGQWGWSNPDYIKVSDNLRATSAINQIQGQSYQLIATQFQLGSGVNNTFIPPNFQPSGIYFTFERSQNLSDDSVVDSGIYLVTNYVVQSGTDKSIGLWGTDEHPGTIIGGAYDNWSQSLAYSDVISSGFGVAFRAATNSLGAGTAYVDSVSCTVCGIVSNVLQSLPLFIPSEQSSLNAIPLFTWGSTLFSSGIPLYIDGYTTGSGGIPLFLQWVGSGNNSFPLFLENINPASGYIPLYMSGTTFGNNNNDISLFLKGKPIFDLAGGIPLSLTNLASSGGGGGGFVTMPLFLASQNFHNGISLYLGVPSIGTYSDGATLYTIGGVQSSNGSVPLFLENWATNSFIPLLVKNLSQSPNAQIDDTGFYPFAGNLALYLGGPYGNSIPLFLASNTPLSGNLPLYLNGSSGLNNLLPLFLETGYASGNSLIPLFTRGF